MNKDIEYSPFTLIKIKWEKNYPLNIESGKNDIQIHYELNTARVIGNWIVECKNKMLYLREVESFLREDDCIILNISREIPVTIVNDGKIEIIKTKHVRIYPHQVHKIRALF